MLEKLVLSVLSVITEEKRLLRQRTIFCNYCRRKGHIKDRCHRLNGGCFRCSSTQHRIAECPLMNNIIQPDNFEKLRLTDVDKAKQRGNLLSDLPSEIAKGSKAVDSGANNSGENDSCAFVLVAENSDIDDTSSNEESDRAENGSLERSDTMDSIRQLSLLDINKVGDIDKPLEPDDQLRMDVTASDINELRIVRHCNEGFMSYSVRLQVLFWRVYRYRNSKTKSMLRSIFLSTIPTESNVRISKFTREEINRMPNSPWTKFLTEVILQEE